MISKCYCGFSATVQVLQTLQISMKYRKDEILVTSYGLANLILTFWKVIQKYWHMYHMYIIPNYQ